MKTGVSTSPRRVWRTPALALLEASVLRRVYAFRELTGIKGKERETRNNGICNSRTQE
jgi:hypothetical protein